MTGSVTIPEPANDRGPVPPSEQVWRVCGYMRISDERTCKRCPASEDYGHHGRVSRGCYLIAAEMINVVETGSPWRDGRKVDGGR